MDMTRSKLIEKGWVSIGVHGTLEYMAREREDEEIQYIPIYNDKPVGYVQSISKGLVKLLNEFNQS